MQSFITDLKKVPVLRVLFPVCVGIIASFLSDVDRGPHQVKFLVMLNISLMIVSVLLHTRKKSFLFSLIFFHWMIIAGMGLHVLTLKKFSGHLDGKELVIIGRIIDPVLRKDKTASVNAECIAVLIQDSLRRLDQNMHVYLQADSAMPDMIPGETYVFGGILHSISNRGNPGEFDYRSYMQRRNYAYTMSCRQYARLENRPLPLRYLPSRVRKRMLDIWKQHIPDISVLAALTLGYKSLLESDLKQSFSHAGAMHLLAVSGLHVGMIWWVLNTLLSLSSSRWWSRFRIVCILSILWFYAGMTGFSESVTRSVSMFSLVTIAQTVKRDSSIFNTVFLSALILLFIRPDRLFDAGFQLSYIAVLGIVSLQPVFSGMYKGNNKILSWLVDLVSVSLAAQLSTLPLVLYYFQLFPVWFLLTNIVAIPMVSLLLALFVIFSPFFLCFPEVAVFPVILQRLTDILVRAVGFISRLPFSTLESSLLPPLAILLLGMAVFFIVLFVNYRRILFLTLSVAFFSVFWFCISVRSINTSKQNNLSLYNTSSVTILSGIKGSERLTFVLPPNADISPYDSAFLSGLDRIPPGIRQHRIGSLSDSVHHEGEESCMIDEGLYGITLNEFHILYTGKCRAGSFEAAMCNYGWDMVIFSRGYPFQVLSMLQKDSSVLVIGDGLLRNYESNELKQELADRVLFTRDGSIQFDRSGIRILHK